MTYYPASAKGMNVDSDSWKGGWKDGWKDGWNGKGMTIYTTRPLVLKCTWAEEGCPYVARTHPLGLRWGEDPKLQGLHMLHSNWTAGWYQHIKAQHVRCECGRYFYLGGINRHLGQVKRYGIRHP